jgi:dTDP-glucose 4,6-dehydratase
MKTILVTGGCGFIGHHFIEHICINTDWNVIVIDKLSYASIGFDRLRDAGIFQRYNDRVKVFTADLILPITVGLTKEIGDINYIVHMAAETHVTSSITDPRLFIRNNIESTVNILEYARNINSLEKIFYFSTDEVFGPAPINTMYKEWDRHRPGNPYSASKSAAEQICVSYENTYKLPIIIVNVMNAFGERQHMEKFIPLCINKLLNNETIDIHCYTDGVTSGTRFYIHARNIAAAVLFLLDKGTIGEKYNISGKNEISNLDIAIKIARIMNMKPKLKMTATVTNRPGHDIRYSLDGSKLNNMGFEYPIDFEETLEKTIKWTLAHPKWLQKQT